MRLFDDYQDGLMRKTIVLWCNIG